MKSKKLFNVKLDEIEKVLTEDIKAMPNDLVEAVLDRAYKDAQQIFDNDEQNEFKTITYAIYKAYMIGMLIEKNKFNKSNDANNKIIDFKAL